MFAEVIYQSWCSSRSSPDSIQSVGGKQGRIGAARSSESVVNVINSVCAIQSAQMVANTYALVEGAQAWITERMQESRLRGEHYLQQLSIRELKVGQDQDLIKNGQAEPMRLIYDEQHSLSTAVLPQKVAFECIDEKLS